MTFRRTTILVVLGVIFSVPYPTEARMMPVDAMSWDNSATFGEAVCLDGPFVRSTSGHGEFSAVVSQTENRSESPLVDPLVLVFLSMGLLIFFIGLDRPPVRASNMHFVRG